MWVRWVSTTPCGKRAAISSAATARPRTLHTPGEDLAVTAVSGVPVQAVAGRGGSQDCQNAAPPNPANEMYRDIRGEQP
jgi:hypothetical protein